MGLIRTTYQIVTEESAVEPDARSASHAGRGAK